MASLSSLAQAQKLVRDKHSSLFGLIDNDEEKSFLTLIPSGNLIKLFTSSLMKWHKARVFIHGKLIQPSPSSKACQGQTL
jgi:hypothetical protein